MELALCFHFSVDSGCQAFLVNTLAPELSSGLDPCDSYCTVKIITVRDSEKMVISISKSIILTVYPSCFPASPFLEMAQWWRASPTEFRFWG